MPKNTISILERIQQSEAKIKELIQQRNKELLAIITRYNAIAIDDKLLAGFLIFAANQDNKDHPILKEFKALATKAKPPSKTRQPNNQSTQRAN